MAGAQETDGAGDGRLLADFAATIEEWLRVSTYFSPRASLWKATHGALSLPFRLWGRPREGVAAIDGEDVRIGCAGREPALAFFLRGLFAFPREMRSRPAGPLWQVAELPRDCDLAVIDLHPWLAPRFRAAGWLVVPHAVRWVGDLADLPPRAACRGLRDEQRKVQEGGYHLELAGAADDWRVFHTAMVAPLARRRFGSAAWIPSWRFRRELARRGRLLFVCRDGERVAGVGVVARGDTLWAPVMGIRGGDARLVREGAAAALHTHAFAWARGQGFRRLDWGRTPPFLNDGLQRYRRKWGLHPIRDALASLVALRVDPACAPVRRAFARRPVFVDTGTGLSVFAG